MVAPSDHGQLLASKATHTLSLQPYHDPLS